MLCITVRSIELCWMTGIRMHVMEPSSVLQFAKVESADMAIIESCEIEPCEIELCENAA